MNEEPNTDTQLALSDAPPLHPCPYAGCNKEFSSPNGVRMHVGRTHTKALGTGYQWKKKMTREEKLLKRREYSRKWRIARGQKPRPDSWMKDAPPDAPKSVKTRSIRKIIYPDPREQEAAPPQPQITTSTIRFCPYCGSNIERHK